MTRQSLWSVVALGAVIASLSGAGVVAVFSDTATTGASNVSSGDQPHFDGLKIADGSLRADASGVDCAEFSPDLQTALFSLTNAQPGDGTDAYICLRNDFDSALTVTASAIDLVDGDPLCTGDEAEFDATCGSGQGELSNVLQANIAVSADCSGTASGQAATLSTLATTPLPVTVIDPAQTVCVLVGVRYNPSSPSESERQAAQTDDVTWRFAFAGTE